MLQLPDAALIQNSTFDPFGAVATKANRSPCDSFKSCAIASRGAQLGDCAQAGALHSRAATMKARMIDGPFVNWSGMVLQVP